MLCNDEKLFFFEFSTTKINSLVVRSYLLQFLACFQVYRIYEIKNGSNVTEEALLQASLCEIVTAACVISSERYRVIGSHAEDLTLFLNGIVQMENILKIGNNLN